MTRGYIKKVTSLTQCEDIAYCKMCHCESNRVTSDRRRRSHSSSSSRQLSLTHKTLLIALMTLVTLTSCVKCVRHLPTLQPPNNSIESSSEAIDSNEGSYEGEDEEDNEDGTYTNDEVRKFYEQQKANYTHIDASKLHTQHSVPATTAIPKPACVGSCLDRPTIESAAIDSIKNQLLMKLGIEKLPNVTKAHKLPEKVLEALCLKNNMPAEYCTGRSSSTNVEYQSDEPANFSEFDTDVIEEVEEVQYLSVENRIYAYPSTAVKYRHKSHLIFSFAESQENNNMVVQASLNLFVHSRKYLLANNLHDALNLKYINVEIAEILSSEKHKLTFGVFENVSIVENGDGKYVQLNITQLVSKWFQSHESSHGINVKITSSADGSKVSNRVVALDADDLIKRPFIDIQPKDQRKKRSKRSSFKCSRDSDERRCCRRPLTVDFEKFGWDWIIAPKRYDANYCTGECKAAFLQKYAHTHVVQMSTSSNPCCSPRRMSAMQLLYFDNNLNIVLGTIPNMIVEECFCA